MGELFNWLKTTEAAVGAVTAVAGVIWWMVRWFDRRQQARADSVLSDISREGASHAERVAELAVRVGNLEAGHGALEDKMILVQEQLKGLATARDMEALRGDIRENNANTAAEVRMITGMVDTLYKAALEAGKNPPGAGLKMKLYLEDWPVSEIEEEKRRGLILRHLDQMPQSEAGEIMLMQALRERGVPTVREQVAATLSWLNIRGLVKAELPGGVYVAKLTAQGRSVARDEFRYDGVAPPELG